MNTKAKSLLFMTLLHVIMMHVAYFILAANFDFPEVLRRSPAEMLGLYMQKQSIVQPAYYLFTLTGLSFVALVVVLDSMFQEQSISRRLALVFGILTGLLQLIGFGRWVFLVPLIAKHVLAGQDVEVWLAIMDAFHHFAGVFLGENIAFVCQGIWTMSIAIAIRKQQPREFQIVGFPIGILIVLYSLEQFGGIFSFLGLINIPLQLAWLIWLLSMAVYFLYNRIDMTMKERLLIIAIYLALYMTT